MWKVRYWSAWTVKTILWIAQVLLEIRRQLAQFIEYAGKRQPIDGQDRILRIHDVEPDVSVVHIDDDLHGVADVVQPVKGSRGAGLGPSCIGSTQALLQRSSVLRSPLRICVRKVIRDRIGILDPVQLSLAQYGVGIIVEAQERSDLCNALANVSMDLNSALRSEIGSHGP